MAFLLVVPVALGGAGAGYFLLSPLLGKSSFLGKLTVAALCSSLAIGWLEMEEGGLGGGKGSVDAFLPFNLWGAANYGMAAALFLNLVK